MIPCTVIQLPPSCLSFGLFPFSFSFSFSFSSRSFRTSRTFFLPAPLIWTPIWTRLRISPFFGKVNKETKVKCKLDYYSDYFRKISEYIPIDHFILMGDLSSKAAHGVWVSPFGFILIDFFFSILWNLIFISCLQSCKRRDSAIKRVMRERVLNLFPGAKTKQNSN